MALDKVVDLLCRDDRDTFSDKWQSATTAIILLACFTCASLPRRCCDAFCGVAMPAEVPLMAQGWPTFNWSLGPPTKAATPAAAAAGTTVSALTDGNSVKPRMHQLRALQQVNCRIKSMSNQCALFNWSHWRQRPAASNPAMTATVKPSTAFLFVAVAVQVQVLGANTPTLMKALAILRTHLCCCWRYCSASGRRCVSA